MSSVKETKPLDHMASEDWSAASEKTDFVESGKSSMCRRSTRTDLSDEMMDKVSLEGGNKLLRVETERETLQSLDHPFLPILYTHFETR
ncbi:hypothetical protein Tco_1567583, partial [Tanacetum coccineum]